MSTKEEVEEEAFVPFKGHCTCKTITYTIHAPFLCTICCHCTWCQRETGSAFVINSIIETSNFAVTSPVKPLLIATPSLSDSRAGQTIARCPSCYVVVYSDYGGEGEWTTFVRAGTLEEGAKRWARPDVHTFTGSKREWVDLRGEVERGVPVLEGYYDRSKVWRREAMERFEVLKGRMREVEGEGKIYKKGGEWLLEGLVSE